MTLSITDIESAAARIAARVHRTPVITSRSLDALCGPVLTMKAENLQRAGAFKARGAFNALLSLGSDGRERGVVTVSSGNHGQAVALAARELGIAATVVMPADANPVKVAAVRAFGAEVVQEGTTEANREQVVRELAEERGFVLVHPFDDERVMAGQGTLVLEWAEQSEPPDVVVAPVGGGGLLSGVAVAAKDRWPRTRVVGVEPAGADDARRSLEAGRVVALDHPPDTIVDGVRSRSVGERPWAVISRFVDDIVTVSDVQTLEAMELLWTRAKTVVEPAAAMPLAAVMAERVRGTSIGLILSGGNVDLDAWARHRIERPLNDL